MNKILLHVFLLLPIITFAQRGNKNIAINTNISNTNNILNIVKCATDAPDIHWENEFQTEIEKYNSQSISDNANGIKVVYNIPVIVHVIHDAGDAIGTGDNISLSRIQSQLNVLNNDYGGTGYNVANIPSAFSALLANCEINFIMAQRNPSGNQMAVPGVDRITYQSKGFTAPGYSKTYINSTVKPSTIWDPTKYLNIWVCDLTGGLLGYATFPPLSSLSGISAPLTGTTTSDGVVIASNYFGVTVPANAPYNRGRTVTHEVGHWMGLRHIWGDAGNCGGSDFCADTPPQQGGSSAPAGSNYGCPPYPFQANTCTRPDGVSGANVSNTNGDMFMNFMDYTDDACMYMFTQNQKTRMLAGLTSSSMRASVISTNNNVGNPVGGSANACDTLTNFSASSYFTLKAIGINASGYIAGHNSYIDKSKAERFNYPTSFASGAKVKGLACIMSVAKGSGSTDFKMWSESASFPNTVLATKSVVNNTLNTTSGFLNYVIFNTPVTLVANTPFYLGASLNYSVGDTVAFGITNNGAATSNTCYEQFSDNTWHAFTETTVSWGGDFNMTIFALVCDINSGINEKNNVLANNVFVYPNPSTGVFKVFLTSDKFAITTLKVTDLRGKILLEKIVNGFQKNIDIDLSTLENGYYFLQVSNNAGIITKKITLIK